MSFGLSLSAVKGDPENLLAKMVALLNDYKYFIDLELIFDSREDFLYRQKGQRLYNSIIEDRDNNMGILIGQKTFGKGVMQTLLEFGDGSALKLTVGEFFTPLGHTVHEVGLTPDIVVPDDGDPEQVAISWIHDHVGSRMPMPIDGTTP